MSEVAGGAHMTLKVPLVGILDNLSTLIIWKPESRYVSQESTNNKHTHHTEHALRTLQLEDKNVSGWSRAANRVEHTAQAAM
jgi:hypothetical protein